jgi:predicted signal transduction protein with EAL and GGDEF domain
MVLHDCTRSIGASIGLSIYPTDGEDAENLLKKADLAMYCAKEHGRMDAQ